MASRIPALATIVTLALCAPAAAKNLIADGGFETPSVGGSYMTFVAGQSFGGWTVVGNPQGNVAPISGSFTQNGFSFPAKTGMQWIDLTGNVDGTTGMGVAQTVRTHRGTRYVLSFAVGNVVDTTSNFGTSSAVAVVVGGKRVVTAQNAGGGTTQAWQTFSKTIRAKSKHTRIQFFDADPAADTSNGLDAVSLKRKS